MNRPTGRSILRFGCAEAIGRAASFSWAQLVLISAQRRNDNRASRQINRRKQPAKRNEPQQSAPEPVQL